MHVVTADGTTQLVSITIHGQNDAAVITGFSTGVVTEAGAAAGRSGWRPAVGDVDNTSDACSPSRLVLRGQRLRHITK